MKDEQLTGHLQSPDFFDAERYPEISFRAGELELADGGTVAGTGELTIKGVTKPVELQGRLAAAPSVDPFGRERLGLALETAIDRNEFGVSWNAPNQSGGNYLGDEVKLKAELALREAGGLTMRILAVSGSLRESSFNTSLLRAALEAAPDGVEVELWEGHRRAAALRRGPRAATRPSRCSRLREAWAAADAILFSTPEYNGSVPGGLKNAIDWASRPRLEAVLRNKPVAVVGASTGQFGAIWAQQDLKRILGIAGARVVGTEIPVARAHERFDAEGRLLDARGLRTAPAAPDHSRLGGRRGSRASRCLSKETRGRLRGPSFQ